MNELLVTAMESARNIMQAQAVNTNNLANVSTDGFKAELAFVAESNTDGNVYSSPDLTSGVLRTTGRDLDVSINGEGWFSILAEDGGEAYSRRGDFRIDAFGQLSDGAGHLVLGNSGPIALPPFSTVEIGTDGTISIQPLGQAPNTLAVVDRIKLVKIEDVQLTRDGSGMLRMEPGEVASADASVKVISGSLESSNVNAVAEMVKMIELARRFESQVKLMQDAKENAMALTKIMSMT